MTLLGNNALLIAFIMSLYSAGTGIMGGKLKNPRLLESARRGALATFYLTTLAVGILLFALITRDFSIEYVANYTSKSLPMFYTISALWAGQAGSLLFWAWLLTLFTVIIIIQNKKVNQQLLPYAIGVLMSVSVFFFLLLIFTTNPFTKIPLPPADGMGMNPMLINPGMVFHPPLLYLGYVGFTVPFAFALAALLSGNLDTNWIQTTRRWTIMSWIFLTAGNLFGAYWAYVELGWGGYWAWDPVENAGILPWITGTAFLHSVMIQEKRGMLKIWNMVLIILTFALTIFGTFVTRSGVISSVHSFGVSNLGPLFIIFLGIILITSFYLLFLRKEMLSSKHELDSFLSKESTFLFNNLLLVGLAFAIFWGTIFPIISEAVRGVKITVGPPFFNQVAVPIGLALLFLTGVCPLIAWQKTTTKNLQKNFLIPTSLSLITLGVLYIAGIRSLYTLMSFTLAAFVAVTIFLEFVKGTLTRARIHSENFLVAFWRLVDRNKRRYGGYIIHIGVVMVFVGITGSTVFQKEKVATLHPGESMALGSFTLHYDDLTSKQGPDYQSVIAQIHVEKDGRQIAILNPEKRFFENRQPTTEVDIFKTLKQDIYVILGGYEKDKQATFKVFINPLVGWLWYGGMTMVLGGLLAIGPNNRKRRKNLKEKNREKSKHYNRKAVMTDA
ncbi:MAG: heme lyase CcmF/NrfE family subunit [Calditrichaeota bacterium]|nr:heme lyase CcmF/NrfE family subunit [Calditrichota bacterium]